MGSKLSREAYQKWREENNEWYDDYWQWLEEKALAIEMMSKNVYIAVVEMGMSKTLCFAAREEKTALEKAVQGVRLYRSVLENYYGYEETDWDRVMVSLPEESLDYLEEMIPTGFKYFVYEREV